MVTVDLRLPAERLGLNDYIARQVDAIGMVWDRLHERRQRATQ